MRPLRRSFLVITVLLLLTTLAAAEEIVRFHDGRFLKVRDHSTENRAMRVDFPGGSFILFPAKRVDVIDRDGRIVYVGPSSETDGATTAVAAAETTPEDRPTLLARHNP